MAHGSQKASVFPGASLRCTLQAEGFSAVELRCGLFGSDLELLDANECPEKLGCSRSAVMWATGQIPGELELNLQLDDLPVLVEYLVLATVGRTGSQGGALYLSVRAGGRFHHKCKRNQFPEHGQSTFTQGSMLAVLSRMPKGWLLQEVVPNIGLSCEQQQDATVRELYWPEVGVAIERTVLTEAGPSVTWLEVFRAYPDGAVTSDNETETASHGSPLGSRPELVSPYSPHSSELDKASLGSGHPRPKHQMNQVAQAVPSPLSHPQEPLSVKARPGLLAPDHRDFGPPRATAQLDRSGDFNRQEMAELCQEAGRLSVSLKLSEDRLHSADSLVKHLRGEVTKLQEEKINILEADRVKENQVLRLRSELDHCMSELVSQNGTMHAQREELGQMARARAKDRILFRGHSTKSEANVHEHRTVMNFNTHRLSVYPPCLEDREAC